MSKDWNPHPNSNNHQLIPEVQAAVSGADVLNLRSAYSRSVSEQYSGNLQSTMGNTTTLFSSISH